jgi:SAM-dependent methyltransferase
MREEKFQPISVRPPSSNPLLFRVRCVVDLQLATIVKFLRPAMSDLRGRILDVGAGESPWLEWLPMSCSYHGIDVVNSQDYGMNANRRDITYYDGRTMPFQQASFDGALCIEVLEHVENPEEFVSEISRVLTDGSTLLLSVPWSARRHHIPHDYHRFTKERLGQLLQTHGFTDLDIQERGNDIGAIASKLVVLTIRLLRPSSAADGIWSWPLAVLVAPMAAVMLGAAHISEAVGQGSKEDPLGYFVRARRATRVGLEDEDASKRS